MTALGLRLYSRQHCHLCVAMAAELEARGLAYEFVDIDADAALRARYDWEVPVLVGAEGEICRHFLDWPALQAYLQR